MHFRLLIVYPITKERDYRGQRRHTMAGTISRCYGSELLLCCGGVAGAGVFLADGKSGRLQLASSRAFSFRHYPLNLSRRRPRLFLVANAVNSSQPSPSSPAIVSGKTVVTDEEFSLAKVSFGVIGLAVGCSLLGYGFGAYFTVFPGSEWSAIMLTYGFPLSIIGMALKYAELKPVPCTTYADAQILREACATPILKQVRDDVIRYRYGDEQHLDEALKRIFQYGQGGGISRRNAPKLTMIREEVTAEGKYCLILVFEAKALQLSDFEQRQAKFASFFGPGITAEIGKGADDSYEVSLISDTIPQRS